MNKASHVPHICFKNIFHVENISNCGLAQELL